MSQQSLTDDDTEELADVEERSLNDLAYDGDLKGIISFLQRESKEMILATINIQQMPCEWGGMTALHHACMRGDCDIAQLLVDHGADAEMAIDYGFTALHFAVRWGHLPVARMLLEHSDADVNSGVCTAGSTPLHSTAQLQDHQEDAPEIVKILLENGADITVVNIFGRTALHIAASRSLPDLVRAILEHSKYDEQQLKDYVSREDGDGFSPLQLAIAKKSVDCMRVLVEFGAEVHQPLLGRGGITLLTVAEENSPDVVEELIRFMTIHRPLDRSVKHYHYYFKK